MSRIIKPRHRHREPLEFSLNITSLMDVLTVLLFFLLKSFTVSSTSMDVTNGLRLPASSHEKKIEDTITLAFTPTEIRSGNEVLVRLSKGNFRPVDIGPDHRTLLPVQSFLKEQLVKRNEIFGKSVDKKLLPPGRLLIQADQSLPFEKVKFLLHSASTSGYSDFDFVVTNPEE